MVGTSCNLVLQYLVSGGEAPVLAAKTLVLRAIAGVGRGGVVGVVAKKEAEVELQSAHPSASGLHNSPSISEMS